MRHWHHLLVYSKLVHTSVFRGTDTRVVGLQWVYEQTCREAVLCHVMLQSLTAFAYFVSVETLPSVCTVLQSLAKGCRACWKMTAADHFFGSCKLGCFCTYFLYLHTILCHKWFVAVTSMMTTCLIIIWLIHIITSNHNLTLVTLTGLVLFSRCF